MLKNIILPVVWLMSVIPIADAEVSMLEIIPVYNRPASEIQPLLEPLLGENDRAIADGANLLVKTTPERLAEIKSFVKKLDIRLHNLLITVVQSRQATADELNARARAELNIRGGDPLKTTGNFSAYSYQTQEQGENDNSQTIRTLEGSPAVIKTGHVYPVQNYQTYSSGYGYYGASSSTEFVEASTGFSVTPRLAGGRQVLLEISPWSDNMGAQGRIQTQEAQTTLKANLGEWIELAGADESSQSSANRMLGRSWQTDANKLHIVIKVDKSD